jgi:hypothetical protein
MINLDQILLIRALNATKQSYFPSYIGVRLIGKDLSPSSTDYLSHLIKRRLDAGDPWSYRTFQLYKGTTYSTQGATHEYRDCVAPSPSTALAGAFVLEQLAQHPAFVVPPRVYSYRWPPSKKAGSSYQFFAEGYKQRNIDISKELSEPGRVAVVTDIKRFYPSVERTRIEAELKSLLSTTPDKDESIVNFFSQLLSAGNGGIPIGPAPGHLLGHVALRKVDAALTAKYGNSYFRYVDDIVIVCGSSDRKEVQRDIQRLVLGSGFDLNTDKTENLTAMEWQNSILRPDVPDGDDFRTFTRELTIYLALHPERTPSLEQLFSEAGLSIPVNRLFALSSYSRFRYFLSRRKSSTGLLHTSRIFLQDNDVFLRRALRLKAIYETSLALITREPAEILRLRRWRVQRARRVVNSLFYLKTFGEWKDHEEIFEMFPELMEQAALATALKSGTVNPILPFYGSAPAAFAELWQEHGDGIATLDPSDELNAPKIDALTTLRLHGVITEASLAHIEQRENSRLLFAVSDTPSVARKNPDLTLEDEFESLRLGTDGACLAKIARTRHSVSEGNFLEALSLLGSEYRS